MSERLLSVGLDVGTTSTQMVVSRLEIENKASAFAVPEMVIAQREVIYESPVHFTPLIGQELVDGQGIRDLLEAEYARAGITREQVDTGAIIITGETSRKENAAAVLSALSDHAGDFVVATAGPDLESILAARGAGAVDFSEKTGKRVLHMDIGGGTSNLALIEKGKTVRTGCFNVGGRLVKLSETGEVTYLSPVLGDLTDLKVGQRASLDALDALARKLVQTLEAAAGLGGDLRLQTAGASSWMPPEEEAVISFSGGVADCIEKEHPPFAFGDMGPILGRALRQSKLCKGAYRLGEQTIRATVIGAGCHSTQLSGSTVYHRNIQFPMKNLPVAPLSEKEQDLEEAALAQKIAQVLSRQDGVAVLALPGYAAPGYERVTALARAIAKGLGDRPALVALEEDMAKALGQALALRLPEGRSCLCIDRVRLASGSYLDLRAPVGPALPLVVKTLVFGEK